MNEPTTETAVDNFGPFFDAVRKIAHGAALDRLNSATDEVALAVLMHRMKGTVTVTMALTPDPNDEQAVGVDIAVKANAPQPKIGGVMFGDDRGRLSRTRPDDLPLPGMGD